MGSCKGIVKGAIYDCDNPPIGGVDERLILFNLEDLLSVTYAGGSNPNVISGITLKSGAQAFVFEGTRNSNQPSHSFVPGTFVGGYDHLVNFHVFEKGQDQKDNLEKMAYHKVVAIIENNDQTFEVFGLKQGLEVQEQTRELFNTDTAGAFVVSLKTSDNSAREPKMPQDLFLTDYTTTRDLVDDLARLPLIYNISPDSVLVAGGTAVTIKGKNYFLNAADDVQSVTWVKDDLTTTAQGTFVTDNDGQISIASSVALAAGNYAIRIVTTAGTVQSDGYPIVSA